MNAKIFITIAVSLFSLNANAFFGGNPSFKDADCVQSSSVGWCFINQAGIEKGVSTASSEEAKIFSEEIQQLSTSDVEVDKSFDKGLAVGVAVASNIGNILTGNVVGALMSATGINAIGAFTIPKEQGKRFTMIFTANDSDASIYKTDELNQRNGEILAAAVNRLYNIDNAKFSRVSVPNGNRTWEANVIEYSSESCGECMLYVSSINNLDSNNKLVEGSDVWNDGRRFSVLANFAIYKNKNIRERYEFLPSKMVEMVRYLNGDYKLYVPRAQGRNKAGFVFDGARIEYVVTK